MSKSIFKPIDTAPRDGAFVRLRFRPWLLMPADHELIGQWQDHAEMPAGGAWFTRAGEYVSPVPTRWAPEHGGFR